MLWPNQSNGLKPFILILIIILFSNVYLNAQNNDSEEDDDEQIERVKKEYEKRIESLRDFYFRYLNERIEQERLIIKKEKNEATIDSWHKLLIQIEDLDRKQEYSKIMRLITLFDDKKIKIIKEDKDRLKVYFSKLEAEDQAKYERIKKKELEILFEDFIKNSMTLAVASKFVEMRETFLQLIAENPALEKNEELIQISQALNVLLASRNLAYIQLERSVGKKNRIRGIEVSIESFDGQTLIVKDSQRGQKTYLFNEFHLNDFLTLLGLKSYDGEFLFQSGVKYYLEGQYKKAQETLLLAYKKGVNCRKFLFATEAKLGDIQRGNLLEAEKLIEQKKYHEAEIHLSRMLKEKPDDLEANFLLGELRVGQNRISEAYGVYEDLIKKYPDHEATLRMLSDLGHKLKLSDSYQWSIKLLTINPDDKEHGLIVCKEYKKQEKFDKYLELALKIQKQNIGLIEPNLILADAYLVNQKWEECQAIYEKILKDKPTQWDAQQGKGECFYQQKKFKEAQEYYEELLVKLKSEKKKDIIRNKIKELLNRNK